MFNWRRRNEGFEWREYVRTTILVRRQERRERVKDAQAAAVAGLKEAGRASAAASATGARAVGRGTIALLSSAAHWLVSATRTVFARALPALGLALQTMATAFSRMARAFAAAVLPPLEPVLAPLRNPRADLALRILVPVAGLAAAYRAWSFGADADVVVAATIAILGALLLLAARLTAPHDPARSSSGLVDRLGDRLVLLPFLDRLTPRGAVLATGLSLALAGLAAALLLMPASPESSSPTSLAASPPKAANVEPVARTAALIGRATALTGGSLRIAGKTLVLDGIEAPELDQTCTRANGAAWRCGSAAKDALARLVRGRRIACEPVAPETNGATRARCTVEGEAIAAKLVRGGHVFAAAGLFSAYANDQSAAKEAQAGLWSGTAERPAQWRDRRWEEAKAASPNSCPIKGRITSGERVYVLPWAPSYDRVRLSPAKGERWFCTEAEARAAGFRATP